MLRVCEYTCSAKIRRSLRMLLEFCMTVTNESLIFHFLGRLGDFHHFRQYLWKVESGSEIKID